MATEPVQAARPDGDDAPRDRTAETKRTSFLQRYTGWGGVIAWFVSCVGHATLFALLIMTPWLASMVVPEPIREARTGLADTDRKSLSTSSFAGGVLSDFRVPAHTLSLPTEQVAVPPESFDPFNLKAAGSEEGPGSEGGLSVIGIGTGGGDLDRVGLNLGGGSGPEFFGIGGGGGVGPSGDGGGRGARKVVYVVDRSGSMITTFHIVREEMVRSIGELRRTHRFHIVLFNASDPIENPPKRLIAATTQAKRAATEFLETISPEGGTNPLTALRRAFEVKPDIIYLLTDGVIPNGEGVLAAIREWNSREEVTIHTVAFLAREGQELLQRIARENNGEFRYVSEDEFLNPSRLRK